LLLLLLFLLLLLLLLFVHGVGVGVMSLLALLTLSVVSVLVACCGCPWFLWCCGMLRLSMVSVLLWSVVFSILCRHSRRHREVRYFW